MRLGSRSILPAGVPGTVQITVRQNGLASNALPFDHHDRQSKPSPSHEPRPQRTQARPVQPRRSTRRTVRSEEETFPFLFGGEDFELMPMSEWPLATMDVLDTGDLKAALGGLIVGGDEALARFMAHGPNMGDLEDLFNAASEWAGVENLPNFARQPQLASTQTSEAAMLAHYGVDVLDPSVSVRRVWVLLSRLPAGSWPDTTTAAHWSTEAHLLARLNDAVSDLTWITVMANSKKKPMRPKPMERPWLIGRRSTPQPGRR